MKSIHDLFDSDGVPSQSNRLEPRRLVRHDACQDDNILLLDLNIDRQLGKRLVPAEATIHSSLHSQFVDRLANFAPFLPHFATKLFQAAVYPLADLLCSSFLC